MGAKEVRRNAGEVARYLEHVLPKYERSGGTTDMPPFDRSYKGESAPPVGEHALDVMEANREAARYINPTIEEMRSHHIYYAGLPLNEVLDKLLYNPGVIRNWRRGDTIYEQRHAEAFWKMCLLLGQAITSRYPGVELHVFVSPHDEEARPKTREAQAWTTYHTQCLMVEQLEEVERETGYKGREAMEILSERKTREGKDWSVEKLRWARKVVNKTKKGEVA